MWFTSHETPFSNQREASPSPSERRGCVPQKCFYLSKRSLSPAHLQPHPRPLSEWRGEWKLLFADKEKPHPQPLSEWRGEWTLLVGWKRVVRGDRGNCILKLRKRPSLFEEGVSLQWKGRLFDVKKRPLYLQTIVFTPLSIRRGGGGEALPYLQTMVFTPLSIRRGVGGEAFSWIKEGR